MGSRSRFLHLTRTELWGRRRGTRAGNGKTGPSAAAGREANPPPEGHGVTGSEPISSEAREEPAGKSRYRSAYSPYRKPTQVGRERIPRPTEEALSRNSAKWSRNLGRRGATGMWPQRIGPSNCLPKTQVCAKPQGEVYGLTPARCRKVKGSGQRKRSHELKPR